MNGSNEHYVDRQVNRARLELQRGLASQSEAGLFAA